jgi:hypothetical protein
MKLRRVEVWAEGSNDISSQLRTMMPAVNSDSARGVVDSDRGGREGRKERTASRSGESAREAKENGSFHQAGPYWEGSSCVRLPITSRIGRDGPQRATQTFSFSRGGTLIVWMAGGDRLRNQTQEYHKTQLEDQVAPPSLAFAAHTSRRQKRARPWGFFHQNSRSGRPSPPPVAAGAQSLTSGQKCIIHRLQRFAWFASLSMIGREIWAGQYFG